MSYKAHVLKEIGLFGQSSVGIEDLVEFHAEDGVIVDPTAKTLYRGKDGAREWFIQAAQTLGAFSMKIIHMEEINSSAVYYHALMTLTAPTGDKFYMLVRCTSIGTEVNGEWKIRHEQWDQHPCDAQGNING